MLLYVYKKKKTSRSDILLVGLCESGKTKLYTMLMGVGDKETFTSIKENVGSYSAKNVSWSPIDKIVIDRSWRFSSSLHGQLRLVY